MMSEECGVELIFFLHLLLFWIVVFIFPHFIIRSATVYLICSFHVLYHSSDWFYLWLLFEDFLLYLFLWVSQFRSHELKWRHYLLSLHLKAFISVDRHLQSVGIYRGWFSFFTGTNTCNFLYTSIISWIWT